MVVQVVARPKKEDMITVGPGLGHRAVLLLIKIPLADGRLTGTQEVISGWSLPSLAPVEVEPGLREDPSPTMPHHQIDSRAVVEPVGLLTFPASGLIMRVEVGVPLPPQEAAVLVASAESAAEEKVPVTETTRIRELHTLAVAVAVAWATATANLAEAVSSSSDTRCKPSQLQQFQLPIQPPELSSQ